MAVNGRELTAGVIPMAMKSRSRADVFGTFLENLPKRRDLGDQSIADQALGVLTILAESGPQPIPKLMDASGMKFADFSSALSSMQNTGLLSLQSKNGTEEAELTKAGRMVLDLSRGTAVA